MSGKNNFPEELKSMKIVLMGPFESREVSVSLDGAWRNPASARKAERNTLISFSLFLFFILFLFLLPAAKPNQHPPHDQHPSHHWLRYAFHKGRKQGEDMLEVDMGWDRGCTEDEWPNDSAVGQIQFAKVGECLKRDPWIKKALRYYIQFTNSSERCHGISNRRELPS